MKTERSIVTNTFLSILLIAVMLSGCSGPTNKGLKIRSDNEVRWTVDPLMYGKPPAESIVFKGTWEVWADLVEFAQHYVLCQTGYADYAAIFLNDRIYADVTVSTLFKPVSGKQDQSTGIIFRIQDKNNYYIIRANALKNSVGIYKYVMGNLSLIKEGSTNVPTGKWQELSIEAKGNRIRGFLNGNRVVEAQDDTFVSGKIGLWTKADSVSCFHEVRLRPW